MSDQFQSLVDATFAHANSPSNRESFFKDLISKSGQRRAMKQFEEALRFKSANQDKLRVRERRDGKGLALFWRISGRPERARIDWADLANLPIPSALNPVTAFASCKKARLLFEKATREFEDEIQSGRVTLLARRSSPLSDRSLVPATACPHVVIDDWLKSTGRIAGEPLYDIVVVPMPNEDAAYQARISAAGPVFSKLLPLVIERLWPAGLPPKSRLSDQEFGDRVEREVRRIGRKAPSPKSISRARQDFKGTKLDK